MNSRTPSAEKEFSEFLIRRIGNAGGSLQLQHVTGHLSQVREEVRRAIGTSQYDLMNFLKEHNNLFIVSNNVVSLAKSSALSNLDYDSDHSDNSSVKSHSTLPPNIMNGKGVIVKIFNAYGFIKSKEPIKTEIYFRSRIFGTNVDLTSFLYIGTMVYFNAELRVGSGYRAKYEANRVWKADENGLENNTVIQNTRKSRETGLYDPINLDSEGIIQNVFPNLGFIAVKGDDNNTVFFYKNRVANYDNIVDLTKVFAKGDTVEFNAHRSTKPEAKARWEATKVWKKSGKIKRNVSSTGNNTLCSNNQSSVPKQSITNVKTKNVEMKKNQRGKICPRSNGAVIKFNENELADGDSAVYYISGTRVTEISWEFSEGDDVFFDAVKIKSAPGWKAVLVWVGVKPEIVLPTCLGDFSEFTDEEENGEICSSVYTPKSSSYISGSSSSSLKSVSVKSGSNASKNKDTGKEKSIKLSNPVVTREVRTYSKKKLNASKDSLSALPIPKNSQKVRKAEKKKDFLGKFICTESKTVTDWGDSPYPADESCEDIADSKCYKPDMPEEDDGQSNTIRVTENEVENAPEYSDFVKEEIDMAKDKSLEYTASIKRFNDIKGKVNRVYPNIAEVKSCNLQNTISFFRNDFYSNGKSVEELELVDLKQILKVGDSINFNYFIIVDDFGQNWQIVTKAWCGSKPKCAAEGSPEDFIKLNGLSVTVNNDLEIVEGDRVPCRKFLTSFEDMAPSNSIDELSRTESCSEKSLPFIQPPEVFHRTVLPVDFRSLPCKISQILKNDLLSLDPKVDLNSVSEEIVNIIKECCNQERSNAVSSIQQDFVIRSDDGVCPKCRGKNTSICEAVNTKDGEVQTIITGDIIAQNVFIE